MGMSYASSPRDTGAVKPSELVPFLVPLLVAIILCSCGSLCRFLGFYTIIWDGSVQPKTSVQFITGFSNVNSQFSMFTTASGEYFLSWVLTPQM